MTTIHTQIYDLPANPDELPLPPEDLPEDEWRAKWLEMRDLGLGGSDAATVLDLSPWTSRYTLWCEKRGQESAFGGSEATQWGHLLEEVVAREAARRLGKAVVSSPVMFRSRTHPFMLANVDRLLLDENGRPEGILEVKTTDASNAASWSKGQAPVYYVCQVMHYMAVTGLRYAVLACLIGGNKLVMVTVYADDQMIADIVASEEAFWHQVCSGECPPVDGSASATAALGVRYPGIPGTSVELAGDIAEALERRGRLFEEKKAIEAQIAEIDNLVREALRDAESGTVDGTPVATWRAQSRTNIDSKALAAEEPEIFERFARHSSSRVLRYRAA